MEWFGVSHCDRKCSGVWADDAVKKEKKKDDAAKKERKNIATGETSPAITSFHFFGYSNFSNFYHWITSITRKLLSLENFYHLIT